MPHDHHPPARPKARGSPAALPRAPASASLHELLHHGNGAAYRQLVDTIHDYAIFFLTPQGHIASWSPGAQRIKGYRAEEIIGEHFSIFYTPEALAQGWPAEELRRSAAEGRLEDEGWRLRKDGTRFWANVIITPLRGPSGQLLGYFKVTRDLTDKREQEERLRESEQNLRLLVEGVQDHAMYLLDAGGHIRTWNSGAEKLLGYKAEQVVGAYIAVLYVQEEQDAGRPTAELSAVRASGFMRTEGWRQRADGSRFWADIAATHIQDAGGHSKGFVKLVRDLTERQRLETLESEGRQLSEFIAMLSHELRNPLAPIRNATALLRSFVDKPEAAGCLDMVDRQVAHLKRLVDDLLDVSRITKGKIRLEPTHLEFNTLVRMAVESCNETVKGHGHTMSVRLSNRQLPVTGDATRLTQLVVNLLNNAAKYTPREGRIEVTVEQTNRFAILQVADNGIGMTQALLQRAFQPFVQGARALDRAEGGLGIGLTLVKTITDLHGGTVTAASPGTGKGTVFTVTLPLAKDPAQAAPPATETVVAGSRRVLLVDDHKDAAHTMARLLQLSGHSVQTAHDGLRALALAASMRPEVVLMDIGLPEMDGYEVARRIRELPGLGDVRLIAVTGYGQESDKLAALAAGFHQHLVKPMDPDELARVIAGGPDPA